MKAASTLISITVIFIIVGTGCSGEGPTSSPEENVVVRKSIETVPQEDAETVTVTLGVTPEPVMKKEPGETVAAVGEKGYYITEKGDSLSKIAGRTDIYGNRLKWPIIYRLNMEELDGMANDADFPNREIPAGTRLKIISSLEVQENLTKNPKDYWIINVISSLEEEGIVPNAIKLIRNGYPAYITRVDIEGKEWMRLRVGFFGQKEEADKEGKKLIELLGFSDMWTTKVGDIERGEFGGY